MKRALYRCVSAPTKQGMPPVELLTPPKTQKPKFSVTLYHFSYPRICHLSSRALPSTYEPESFSNWTNILIVHPFHSVRRPVSTIDLQICLELLNFRLNIPNFQQTTEYFSLGPCASTFVGSFEPILHSLRQKKLIASKGRVSNISMQQRKSQSLRLSRGEFIDVGTIKH